MNAKKEVIIIGGGVIGLACAHYLIRDGARVRIIEKDGIGEGASHGNCGLLFLSDALPLCSPGAVRHEIIRTLLGTSPLHIKPEVNLKRWLWLLKFAGKCRSGLSLQAARDKYELLAYSADLFKPLLSLEDMDCDAEKSGVLVAFSEKKNFEAYRKTVDILAGLGIEAVPVAENDLPAREPALSPDVAGAWYYPRDRHLRPEMLMASWQRYLSRKGVIFEEHSKVLEFDARGNTLFGVNTVRGRFEADAFVLAAGAWSPKVMAQLGLDLPVEPGKGYSITMERPALCPTHACYLYETNVVATPWKSGYRLGGTMEFSGFSRTLNDRRLKKLITGAARYMKEPCGHPVLEHWAGLRPMTYDDMPVIDRVPAFDNLMVATGHGMLGLTLATGTGKLISDLVYDRTSEINRLPFRLNRFA